MENTVIKVITENKLGIFSSIWGSTITAVNTVSAVDSWIAILTICVLGATLLKMVDGFLRSRFNIDLIRFMHRKKPKHKL